MGIKAFAAKIFASQVVNKTKKWAGQPVETQDHIFKKLISEAADTTFGKEHDFHKIKSHKDFCNQVPVRDYEDFRPYIEKIIQGGNDILWKGRPIYFAKTSGTTSGAKFIPITKESIPSHINAARDALLHYIHETGNAKFTEGKMIFLSGSPELEKKGGILTGRLSGIVNHHVPAYLRKNQVPSYPTNCIEDWEEKVQKIVEETLHQKMTLISGIPPWVQTYFDKLMEQTGKKVKDIFPVLQLLVHGGVNFQPYKSKIFDSIGQTIDSIETFPASEGFFAFQNTQLDHGLLLLLNSGIFFEFIPASEIGKADPDRLTINEVELDKNYALIVTSNAGLWAYNMGDTIKFVSKDPYKIVVTGRIKHFISAFGEHVIAEEVEKAIQAAIKKENAVINEFTVAPNINPVEGGLPHHQWFIEFDKEPVNIDQFANVLDNELCHLNIYYDDLIKGHILKRLEIIKIRKNGFNDFAKATGKFGGQNKLPRLANDRKIAGKLLEYQA